MSGFRAMAGRLAAFLKWLWESEPLEVGPREEETRETPGGRGLIRHILRPDTLARGEPGPGPARAPRTRGLAILFAAESLDRGEPTCASARRPGILNTLFAREILGSPVREERVSGHVSLLRRILGQETLSRAPGIEPGARRPGFLRWLLARERLDGDAAERR